MAPCQSKKLVSLYTPGFPHKSVDQITDQNTRLMMSNDTLKNIKTLQINKICKALFLFNSKKWARRDSNP